MKVKIKKLNSTAVIPSYAKEGDAGLDLIAIDRIKIEGEPFIRYKTGLAIEIPEGYVGLLFPRSSITNSDQFFGNCVGVIDSGYRGELEIRLKPSMRYPSEASVPSVIYKKGDKVAQLIILPIPYITLVESEELSDSSRGEGGFGSTGK